MASCVKTLAAATVLAMAGMTANAATVINTGTFAGSTDFVSNTGGALFDSDNSYYAAEDANSNWVWDFNNMNSVTYTITFNLSGYDVSTADLSGLWGADNFGSIFLNGTLISSLVYGLPAFQVLTPYTDLGALFNAGVNTLAFVVGNGNPDDPNEDPGPAAFRATVLVTADVAAVPLPAGLPMLAGALGLLGFGAARRRRNTQI